MNKLLTYIFLLLSLGQIAGAAVTNSDIPVEVVEVKDIGLSDRDETKSVIEVSWRTGSIQRERIVSFNLILSITYADGTTINDARRINPSSLSTRVEVPSVKTLGGRTTAFIRKMDAHVFAVISKK